MKRSSQKPVHTIAQILPFPAVGGTEHATLRIAKAIDPSRFTNLVFCLAEAESVRAHFVDAGLPCSTYAPPVHSYRHAGAFLRASARLARELKRQKVDVLHCADLLAAYHAALAGRLAGLPILCHIRNRFDVISRRDRSFLWPVHKFVFVSRNTWRHFGSHVPASRGVVVYDGIDPPLALSSAENRQDVCRELKVPEDAPLVGMMARVAPQKDYATLSRAAARVLRVEPGARFLIAGDNSSTETCREHYQDVVRVLEKCGVTESFIFTGHRKDVARLLDAIDIFVLSTHWEGLPLVILEAMARGKPVVATAVDGIPEIVDDGETGLLFPHEDDQQLAAHITGLLRDRSWRRRLGEAGRSVVQTRFSTAQFAASMNALYAEVLNSKV